MIAPFKKSLGMAALAFCGVASALGQGSGDWGFQCMDPDADPYPPRSLDHNFMGVFNNLFRVHLGLSGNATYGGQNGPCYAPNSITVNLQGRFGFMIGSEGSIQDEPGNQADPFNGQFRDNDLVLTMGMPFDPGGNYCYATITNDGNRTRFGENGFSLAFVGFSGRYMRAVTTQDGIAVRLDVDVIGDAARFQWTLTNTDADTHGVGLWFGAGLGMLTNPDESVADRNGASQSHSLIGTLTRSGSQKPGYVFLPTGRPPITEQRYNRTVDPANFPQVIDFLFGQTAAWGLRVENGETPSTFDPTGIAPPTQADEFVLGRRVGLLGPDGSDSTFPDFLIGDVTYLGQTSFITKFPELPLAQNQSRTVVQFFRTPWSVASYSLPYGVVVDAPQLVASDPTGMNGLQPNPMTIRVYVDNVAGYAGANTEVPLNDVKVTLSLPQGITLAPGEVGTKTIASVPAKTVRSVDFAIEADGIEYGDLAYSVRVEPIPGPVKVLDGTIKVATTPKINLVEGANLVTFPWTFQDTSLEAILGMQIPIDFQAFKWDAQQDGYVTASAAERGKGIWITAPTTYGPIDLQSNPQTPPDIPTGAPLIQLHFGWNLVGNPYPYPILLGQLVGVSGAAPQQSYPWAQLVAQNFVSGSLVFWDVNAQDYTFIQGNDAVLLPNRGHWVYVPTLQDLTISYPAVYVPYLPGSSRSAGNTWVQSDQQWRLQLVARTDKHVDAQNFVGRARNATEARTNRIMEPPKSPTHDVQLSIEEVLNGRPARVAQNLQEGAGRHQWKVFVETEDAATVTVTWPNLATVPKNVRFRLTDRATGETRELRRSSGYTFTVDGPTSREFLLEAIPGSVSSRALIGNVVATRPSRAPNAPFTISYALSSEATTSVRILSGGGKEVFTVTRGRADRVGENSVTWALKDNANRTVAPGSYRVEILAETAAGERVRKIIPINVIR